MTTIRGRGGHPMTGNPKEEEKEGIMGETHETENATYEEIELLADKVAHTMKEILQSNQENMQHTLIEMQNHLSLGQSELHLSLTNFQGGQDRMITVLEELNKHPGILSQFLMEQRHGKDPPLYCGNHEASGSHGGNGNQEESIHRVQMEEHHSNDGGPISSHTLSRTTPRPYMPTFLDTQRREANVSYSENMGEE